jgi:hypothetical protein
MVSASQAAQLSWIVPLVTISLLLVQLFRWDFYDQQNGHGTQGNGQRFINYGGPGGSMIELIPAYNWEVILVAPPYATASDHKGTAEGWGDWPAFVVQVPPHLGQQRKGDYIVTAFLPDVRSARYAQCHLRQRLGRAADTGVRQGLR